jgi:hypothetical protein
MIDFIERLMGVFILLVLLSPIIALIFLGTQAMFEEVADALKKNK